MNVTWTLVSVHARLPLVREIVASATTGSIVSPQTCGIRNRYVLVALCFCDVCTWVLVIENPEIIQENNLAAFFIIYMYVL